jgi:hypothetical protein
MNRHHPQPTRGAIIRAGGEGSRLRELFSSDVLARVLVNLAVLPVRGVEWSDLGEPARVMDTWTRLGTRPRWAAA